MNARLSRISFFGLVLEGVVASCARSRSRSSHFCSASKWFVSGSNRAIFAATATFPSWIALIDCVQRAFEVAQTAAKDPCQLEAYDGVVLPEIDAFLVVL